MRGTISGTLKVRYLNSRKFCSILEHTVLSWNISWAYFMLSLHDPGHLKLHREQPILVVSACRKWKPATDPLFFLHIPFGSLSEDLCPWLSFGGPVMLRRRSRFSGAVKCIACLFGVSVVVKKGTWH